MLVDVLSEDPELIVSGTDRSSILAEFNVIAPEFAMITPPVPLKVDTHSAPAILAVDVLYCRLAAAP